MKIKQIVSFSTILVSLLISCTIADDAAEVERDIPDYEYEIHVSHGDDLVIDDLEYDYEEVVGEDVPKNIVPFHKHPGVYVIDLEGVLYALDADNGEILWARKVSDKLMKVTEAPPPPMNYGEPTNGTSLQPHVKTPFNELVVTLDGYILFPRVDGKFSVFQHSIDNIIDKDTITVQVPGYGDDTSILFMGGKKSSFFSLDEVSGKYSSFGTETPDPRIELSPTLSEVRVIRVEKNVNCLSYRGFEYWNLTTHTLSLQFSNEVMRHIHEITSIPQLDYPDSFSIQALSDKGSVLWKRRFPHLLIQAYYANNDSFVLIKNSRTITNTPPSYIEGVHLISTSEEEVENHVLLALLHSPNLPLLDHVEEVFPYPSPIWPVMERNHSFNIPPRNTTGGGYRMLTLWEQGLLLSGIILFVAVMFYLFKWFESLYSKPDSLDSQEGLVKMPLAMDYPKDVITEQLPSIQSHGESESLMDVDLTPQTEEQLISTSTDLASFTFIPLKGFNLPFRTGLYNEEFDEHRLIGAGAFGAVFLSMKKFEGVDYAVKKVILFKKPKEGNLRRSDFIKAFRVLREVRIFARCDHSNIVRFFTAWIEYIPNDQLREQVPIHYNDDVVSDETLSDFDSLLTDQLVTQEFSAMISQLGPIAVQSTTKTDLPSISAIIDDSSLQSINWNNPTNCPFEFEGTSTNFDQDCVESSESSTSESDDSFFTSSTMTSSTVSLTPRLSARETSSLACVESIQEGDVSEEFERGLASQVGGDVLENGLSEKVLGSQLNENPSANRLIENPTTNQLSENPLMSQLSNNPTTNQLSENPLMSQLSNNPTTNQLSENPLMSQPSNLPFTHPDKEQMKSQIGMTSESSVDLNELSFIETEVTHVPINEQTINAMTIQEDETQEKDNISLNLNKDQLNRILQKYSVVLYIQMGYCGNRTLNNYLQDPSRVVNEEEILNVGVQLCKGLAYLHSKHIIHRDVKPANIFYMEDGSIRLGDFGLSRDLSETNSMNNNGLSTADSWYSQSSESSKSARTTNIGTFLYSSPEQFSQTNYDYKADVFAAGMVLYEMTFPYFKTTSERFFVLDQPKHGKFPESRPGISQEFYRLIQKMLDIDPLKRPTAEEAVEEAMKIMRGRVLVIQLRDDEPFASQQLVITSHIQTLYISKCIKLIMYKEERFQIHVTMMKMENEQLEQDMETIRSLKGVESVYLTTN